MALNTGTECPVESADERSPLPMRRVLERKQRPLPLLGVAKFVCRKGGD